MLFRRPPLTRAQVGQVPSPLQRAFVVVNPIAARVDEALTQLRLAADREGVELVEITTTRKSAGSDQARDALAAGAELIVAVGGDGTVRRVAGALAGSKASLAVLPAGSGNVLARNMGLSPLSLDVAAANVFHGLDIDADLGQAVLVGSSASAEPEPFLVMAGMGRDAETVRDTSAFLKRRSGWTAYAESGVRHALAKALLLRVQYDDHPAREIKTWTLLAGNVPLVPPNLSVFPEARIDDGKLAALEVPIRRPDQWLPIAVRGFGAYGVGAALRYRQVGAVKVSPANGTATVQIDGDVFDDITEMRLTVLPGALRLRVPSEALWPSRS